VKIVDLARGVGGWLTGEGQDSDIVISSRVRIARNVGGFPFPNRASEGQRRELEQFLHCSVMDIALADDMNYVRLDRATETEADVLVERHLISHELAGGEGERGVAFKSDETVSIMVNEEDHLRLQVLQPGLELSRAWSVVSEIDDQIAAGLDYAFDPELGFLTSCPTNVGTGMRVSVMLHLPGLAMARHLEKVFNAMAKIDMIVRGLYGEGTEAVGDLYQISNQKTLGKSEEDIVANLKSVTPQILDYERRVRDAMMEENRRQVEDQVFRAEGILRGAHLISSEETLYLLSRLRLGINSGIISDVDISTVNQLLILTRAAHLQILAGRELEKEERHAVRADYLRHALSVGPRAV